MADNHNPAAVFFCLFFFFIGCSDEPTYKSEKGKESERWTKVKTVIERECVSCHNGSNHPLNFKIEKVFAGSKAQARVTNNTMPPNKALADADKSTILSYFL